MEIKHLENKKDFEAASAKGPMLVDFYTVWCGPCKKQADILVKCGDELKEKFPQLTIHKVDLESNEYFDALGNTLGIHSIPQLVLFNGKAYKMVAGVKQPKDIVEFLKTHIA